MKSKTLKTVVMTFLCATLLIGAAQAASIGGAEVTATLLNFRAESNASSRIITSLPGGTDVVVAGKLDNGWYKVVYKGTVGYVNGSYLRFQETVDGDFGWGTIRGSSVRMRSGPSTSSSILGTYNNRTRMTVAGVARDWYKVVYNGVTGYVRSDYFALNDGWAELNDVGYVAPAPAPAPNPGTGSSTGQAIVDTAMQYLGVPYVWAGTSPDGFDCSGLVYYVYKQHGYSTNRTAATLYDNGVSVDKANLQLGDLVFFTNSSPGIGHVGIYVGDGQFIHASSGSGKVIISRLDSTYYTNHYVGARRII
ncbi:MAG: C40 family peptidase [Oscillospiraceae bacterium]|jgi:cell wall-associated NlpC family hydrolase|nr:C40 family peptidase [Oscillospiraceae bacterium]